MYQRSDKYNFSTYREFTIEFQSNHFCQGGLCNRIKIDVEADFSSGGRVYTRIYKILDVDANEPRNITDFPVNEQALINGLIQDEVTDLQYSLY